MLIGRLFLVLLLTTRIYILYSSTRHHITIFHRPNGSWLSSFTSILFSFLTSRLDEEAKQLSAEGKKPMTESELLLYSASLKEQLAKFKEVKSQIKAAQQEVQVLQQTEQVSTTYLLRLDIHCSMPYPSCFPYYSTIDSIFVHHQVVLSLSSFLPVLLILPLHFLCNMLRSFVLVIIN